MRQIENGDECLHVAEGYAFRPQTKQEGSAIRKLHISACAQAKPNIQNTDISS